MSEEVSKPRKTGGIYLIVILLLAAGVGYLAYRLAGATREINDCASAKQELEADMKGMNDMMSGYVGNMSNDLRKDFQRMLDTYDALKAKDVSQSDSINKQKERIQELLNKLNSQRRWSARELFELNKENETLRRIMKGYVHQIDSLNTLNLQLTSELETKSTQLSSTIEERDQYRAEAEDNAEKVRQGSKLQAYNFSSTGLRMKLNNTTEPTNRARNCVQIKSSFTLSENAIASAGRKVVYLQVTNPEGRILQARADYVTTVDGVQVAYSDRKEIDYNNQQLDMAVFFDLKGEKAVKGNYHIKIFCDQQVIGKDSFTLK
ncbi:MAG: hypothetical protein EP338_07625 [Bacteroidetes bacterium]|nr:MAG: hypothetical protein EP338_07625 [Bacteroidota bacterium]